MNHDNYFGPHLPGVFDFTILFEQSILTLLPAALFICVAPLRIVALARRRRCVKPSLQLWSKQAIAVILFCLEVAQLGLWCRKGIFRTRTTIAEAVISVVEAVTIVALSHVEHIKSVKPSALLNSYLFLSILLGLAPARTYWTRSDTQKSIAVLFTLAELAKAILLVIEELPKRLITREKEVARETQAGVISRSIFWWLNALFLRGSGSVLKLEHLGKIGEKFDSDALLNQLDRAWAAHEKTGKYALMLCTINTFKWQLMAGVLPKLFNLGFTYAQPFLVNRVIDFISESSSGLPGSEESNDTAGGLVGATVLIYVGLAITAAWYNHMTFQLATMWRGSLAAIIYKKTLVIPSESIKDSAPVTLMSTDVEGVSRGVGDIHSSWSGIIELAVAIYLLYQHIGPSSFLIFVPAFVTLVGGALVTPGMEPAMIKWNGEVQARVGATKTMLDHMKGIKMLGLTRFCKDKIHGSRVKEVEQSAHYRWLVVFLQITANFSSMFTPVIIFIGAVFWTRKGEGLSVAQAFTSLSLIQLASDPLTRTLVSVIQFFGLFGCFARIQAFINREDHHDGRELADSTSEKSPSPTETRLHSRGYSSTGSMVSLHPKRRNEVEMSTLKGQPVHSVGQIEAFTRVKPRVLVNIKDATFTTAEDFKLLHTINLVIHQGTINMVVGRVGCGKSSLLKAILGEVKLEQGHVTVNEASWIAYCDQTPWLQNISIRDNIIGKSLYDENWFTTVLEATALDKDVAGFPLGSRTLVGTGGVALSGGQKQRVALARAVYSHPRLLVLDDVFSGLDNRTARHVFQRLFGTDGLLRASSTTVVLATNHVNYLPAADCITMLDGGRIVRNQVTFDSVDPLTWGALAEQIEQATDEADAETVARKATNQQKDSPENPAQPDLEMDMARMRGDWECYQIYFRSMGWPVVISLTALTAGYTSLSKMPQVWLKIWTEAGPEHAHDAKYVGGYVGLTTGSLVLAAIMAFQFGFQCIPNSAIRLHEILLDAIMKAPLSFFTMTDSGITLNRFSQDMTLVDQALPWALYACLLLLFAVIATVGIIASGASYVGIAIPGVILVLFVVQRYYLRTSRQMRLLDLETKSPLYTQFSETLAGLATIRAFGWSDSFMDGTQARLDASQKPFYMMFCIQRWLGVVLDLVVAGLALILVAVAVNLTGSTSKGAIGLAMVNLISFNTLLTQLIEQWTVLETSLGAISRLKWVLHNTPNENKPQETRVAPATWPAHGMIEFEHVTASYTDTSDSVVKDVSLKIKAGQRVGICGRSGSGKSSLIATILRLLELRSGTIRIDSEDLSTLQRQEIRSHLAAVPQDSVQLTGTVRDSLDPEGKIQADEPLIQALRKTTIWDVIEPRGGLDAKAEELGFSAGQLQLFCLARVLLSRSRIVLLDEATSNVDRQTDEEIRRIIKDELAGRTVLEVAHRLDVIRWDCDVVVVMSEGRVVEMGNPDELLQRQDSAFKGLWDSQGL